MSTNLKTHLLSYAFGLLYRVCKQRNYYFDFELEDDGEDDKSYIDICLRRKDDGIIDKHFAISLKDFGNDVRKLEDLLEDENE